MGKLEKIAMVIAGAIGAVVLLCVFTPKVLGLFSKDIPPVNDQDLRLEKINIPQNQNAYFDLLKLGKDINLTYAESEKIKNGLQKKSDEQFTQELIAKNKQYLDIFKTAIKKTKFQNPALADPAKYYITTFEAVPFYRFLPNLARLYTAEIILSLPNDKNTEALDKIIELISFGQKMENSLGGLSYTVGIAIKRIGMDALPRILAVSGLSSDTLIQTAKKIEEYAKNEEALKNIIKMKYIISSNTINLIWTEQKFSPDDKQSNPSFKKIKNSFFFKPNKTKNFFLSNALKSLAQVEKPCNLAEPIDNERILSYPDPARSSKLQYFIKMFFIASFTDNFVGKVLHDTLSDRAFAILNNQRCLEDFQVSAVRILFALKSYQTDAKKLPSSLKLLAPEYLPQLPKDPFDGKEIRYSAKKQIIYSLGEDAVDSGGTITDGDWTKMKDPSLAIPF